MLKEMENMLLDSVEGYKFSPPNVIAVDVDGTLLINNNINKPLVEWCKTKKKQGFDLILWSSQGAEHARRIAGNAGIIELFNYIISKPGYIVDDMGWLWTKYAKIITNYDEDKPTIIE